MAVTFKRGDMVTLKSFEECKRLDALYGYEALSKEGWERISYYTTLIKSRSRIKIGHVVQSKLYLDFSMSKTYEGIDECNYVMDYMVNTRKNKYPEWL